MDEGLYKILFICTGNSARSIMAEVIMNHLGGAQFKAYSAGSQPRGEIHPMTLSVLAAKQYDLSGLRSKSWTEFAEANAPRMDFIITVCDQAGWQSCPAWHGQPITAHWGFADPSKLEGDRAQQLKAFAHAELEVASRIRLFMSLPIEKLDRMSLQTRLRELGQQRDA